MIKHEEWMTQLFVNQDWTLKVYSMMFISPSLEDLMDQKPLSHCLPRDQNPKIFLHWRPGFPVLSILDEDISTSCLEQST